MKLFKRSRKGNNKGFSLVELVCAVAIFAVIIVAVGSVMIVSAQNYSQGTYEIDVQQEAQITTNLIGNLIISADSAYFNSSLAMPLLRIDESDDLAYEIEYDSANKRLIYSEIDKNTLIEASGVLAENVVGFSTNLPTTATDFSADKNVEVTVSIEKGGRTYNASYSMTARNGSSDSTVTDSAKIIVESEIVLEPGQEYNLPVTVLGTIANKAFVVAKCNASDPISLGSNADSVNIRVGAGATGTISFMISTVEKKDDGITAVADKRVDIKIRRVSNMDGTKSVTGTEGAAGSSYVFNFGYSVTQPDKVYGKDFDTNYINPKQFSFSYSLIGGNVGETWETYIDSTTKVEETNDNPSVSFSFKDDKSLPEGAKIAVTCTSEHAAGTKNKMNTPYDDSAFKTLYIEKPRFSSSGDINRGNDNEGVKFIIDESFLEGLNNSTDYDEVIKIIEFYEATIDSNGNYIKGSKAFDRRSDNPADSVEGGNALPVRKQDSDRLRPDQAYIIVVRIECKKDGVVKWPIVGVTPEEEYKGEFPISPLKINYSCHELNEGVAGNYKEVYKITNIEIPIEITGLDMTKDGSGNVKWDVYRKESSEDEYPTTVFTNLTCNVSNKKTNGEATMSLFFQQTGYYKLCARLDGYQYQKYDGSSTSGNFSLNDGENVGVIYIRVK